jgi:large subunit ribosomal protein L24
MMETKNKNIKLKIKKDDTVKVISGNDRGKTGRVLEVIPSKNKAFIEGVNVMVKHVKPSATSPEGGIEKKEAPVHISNLMLIDPATGNPTKVGRKVNEKGKIQRYSKKTGEFI